MQPRVLGWISLSDILTGDFNSQLMSGRDILLMALSRGHPTFLEVATSHLGMCFLVVGGGVVLELVAGLLSTCKVVSCCVSSVLCYHFPFLEAEPII